ncbi:MAG: hypothetical protein ABSG65_17830 [Bryobacteraceae bacterium]|jgi:anti-sigma factor RsiW
MSFEAVQDGQIVRYLLDELPPDEKRLFEQRYFLDDRLFESVCSIEEQLIRDYLRGEIPMDQRRRFEARYLESPPLREKVESARLLAEPGVFKAPSRRSIFEPSILETLRGFFHRPFVLGSAMAGVAAAALLVAVWYGQDNRRLRTELAISESQRSGLAARLQAQAATPRNNPAGAGSVVPHVESMRPAPLAFVLSPGVMRGAEGGRQRLIIPVQGADRVRLNLDFTPLEPHTAYQVVVSSVDGGEVASRDLSGKNLVGSGRKLVIDLSAASLPEGDYIIVVKGRLANARYEDLESYYFHVARGLK